MVSTFRLLQAEQQYNMLLLEEHWMAEEQLEAERKSEAAVVGMVAANPGIISINWEELASMHSAHTIR